MNKRISKKIINSKWTKYLLNKSGSLSIYFIYIHNVRFKKKKEKKIRNYKSFGNRLRVSTSKIRLISSSSLL